VTTSFCNFFWSFFFYHIIDLAYLLTYESVRPKIIFNCCTFTACHRTSFRLRIEKFCRFFPKPLKNTQRVSAKMTLEYAFYGDKVTLYVETICCFWNYVQELNKMQKPRHEMNLYFSKKNLQIHDWLPLPYWIGYYKVSERKSCLYKFLCKFSTFRWSIKRRGFCAQLISNLHCSRSYFNIVIFKTNPFV
jgi:hypothetical protein